MPVYNYKCRECGELWKMERSISERDNLPSCTNPQCVATEPMRRIISPSGFQLKGSGWYKDGYK